MYSQPNVERLGAFQRRVEAWFGTRRKRLVQTFSSKPGVLGDLSHASGLRHVVQGEEQKIGVFSFQNCGHVFGQRCSVGEIVALAIRPQPA